MKLLHNIDINPKIMLGKPVIRGTRITVELILRKLGEGATEQDLLEAYPRLIREDIHAAMIYAALEARQKFALIPDMAAKGDEIRIKRADVCCQISARSFFTVGY